MNTGLRPLPRTIPFRVRAQMMVERGEAKDFGQAASILRHGRTAIAPVDHVAFANVEQPQEVRQQRLPYRDD